MIEKEHLDMIVSKICLQEYKPRLENDTCSENYEPDCEHVSKLDSISQKKKKGILCVEFGISSLSSEVFNWDFNT